MNRDREQLVREEKERSERLGHSDVREGAWAWTGGRTASCILQTGLGSHAVEVAFFLGQWGPSVDSGQRGDSLRRNTGCCVRLKEEGQREGVQGEVKVA